MAKPKTLDLDVVQGDDFNKPLRFRDKITQANLDVTGWTARAQVRKTTDDSLVVEMTILIDNSIAPGMVALSLTDTQTSAMLVGKYNWDLEITIAGDTQTVVQGTFEVYKQYTYT